MRKIHNKNVPATIRNHLLNLEIQKCYVGAERMMLLKINVIKQLIKRAELAQEERAIDAKIAYLTNELKKIRC